MELICEVQNYEWGKKGLNSKVAQLQTSTNPKLSIDEALPYAELWMGTHVNGPSVIKESNQKLSEVIAQHPEYLGEEVQKQFQELPFLFKVLSVNKALSIQAHPSKKHAEELHASFPDIYKDPNHKPEIAIALTPFEALCGFRPLIEIKNFVNRIPELQEIVGSEALCEEEAQFVPKAFKSILTTSKDNMKRAIHSLLKRLNEADECDRNCLLADLVERLHRDYPGDNGILMIYFLNYVKLMPSQSVFLGANVPHAYLFGDCVECMACSDNVVRAGLTPKFVDVDTLCSMLIYKGSSAEDVCFKPVKEDEFSVVFRPPVPDFAVVQIQVPSKAASFVTKPRNSASIVLVISGKAQYYKGSVVPGTVLFLPANEIIEFVNLEEDLLMYQAIANV